LLTRTCEGLFAARLRVEGLRVEELHNHFSPSTPDTHWLPFVGEKKWVAITLDHLRGDPEEQFALMQHNVKVFVLIGKATHGAYAEFFLRKLRWARRVIALHDEPFMARLQIASGEHSLITLSQLMDRYARRRR